MLVLTTFQKQEVCDLTAGREGASGEGNCSPVGVTYHSGRSAEQSLATRGPGGLNQVSPQGRQKANNKIISEQSGPCQQV